MLLVGIQGMPSRLCRWSSFKIWRGFSQPFIHSMTSGTISQSLFLHVALLSFCDPCLGRLVPSHLRHLCVTYRTSRSPVTLWTSLSLQTVSEISQYITE